MIKNNILIEKNLYKKSIKINFLVLNNYFDYIFFKNQLVLKFKKEFDIIIPSGT